MQPTPPVHSIYTNTDSPSRPCGNIFEILSVAPASPKHVAYRPQNVAHTQIYLFSSLTRDHSELGQQNCVSLQPYV